jgi:hypothetical protein
MTWLPGWDSIDSAGFWSHFWFWVGIVCLFAVGASAVISHTYGLRKDKLMSEKVVSLTARQTAEVEALQNKLKEVGALQNKLEQGNTSVPEPPAAMRAKILTPEQQQTLIAALSPFVGQKVRIDTVVGSDDGLANDFVEVFRAAKWHVDPGSPSQVVPAKSLFGLQPTINRISPVPPGFGVLVDTLSALGLGPNTGFADEQTPVGTINLKIGIRELN